MLKKSDFFKNLTWWGRQILAFFKIFAKFPDFVKKRQVLTFSSVQYDSDPVGVLLDFFQTGTHYDILCDNQAAIKIANCET